MAKVGRILFTLRKWPNFQISLPRKAFIRSLSQDLRHWTRWHRMVRELPSVSPRSLVPKPLKELSVNLSVPLRHPTKVCRTRPRLSLGVAFIPLLQSTLQGLLQPITHPWLDLLVSAHLPRLSAHPWLRRVAQLSLSIILGHPIRTSRCNLDKALLNLSIYLKHPVRLRKRSVQFSSQRVSLSWRIKAEVAWVKTRCLCWSIGGILDKCFYALSVRLRRLGRCSLLLGWVELVIGA